MGKPRDLPGTIRPGVASAPCRRRSPTGKNFNYEGGFTGCRPRLVLSTRRQPPGTEALAQIITSIAGEAFPPGHPTSHGLSLDLLREALATAWIP